MLLRERDLQGEGEVNLSKPICSCINHELFRIIHESFLSFRGKMGVKGEGEVSFGKPIASCRKNELTYEILCNQMYP